MSEPTRYACYENYSVSSSGLFIKFSDYEQLRKERDKWHLAHDSQVQINDGLISKLAAKNESEMEVAIKAVSNLTSCGACAEIAFTGMTLAAHDSGCIFLERNELKLQLQSDRKTVLLKAAFDLLKQHQEAHFVESAMETMVVYDEAECDGHCLMEDIKTELDLKDE